MAADDDLAAHGRQDEPAADVRRVAPRLRARAGARARAARLHTRGNCPMSLYSLLSFHTIRQLTDLRPFT